MTIAAGSHHVLHVGGLVFGATFHLSDSEYLIVQPSNKKRWRARWELLTKVSFTYFEPPSDWLAEVLTAQTAGPKIPEWFEREVAELKTELEKLPGERQEQLRRELEGPADGK